MRRRPERSLGVDESLSTAAEILGRAAGAQRVGKVRRRRGFIAAARRGSNRCRAPLRFCRVPAWRSRRRPPLYRRRDPFVLGGARAAVSRLAGIADWTTQPRRDAANYPPVSPASHGRRVGFPEETDYTRYTSASCAPPRRAHTDQIRRVHAHSRVPCPLGSSPSNLVNALPLFHIFPQFFLAPQFSPSVTERRVRFGMIGHWRS